MKKLLCYVSFKNVIRIFLLLILLYGAYRVYAEIKERIRIANLQDTASPNIQVFEDFADIKSLGRKRTIRVYLPGGYKEGINRYPVIYMLDGEDLFSEKWSGGTEWQVDEVIDSIVTAGGPAAIIVAIDVAAENRNSEYRPWDPETGEDSEGIKLLDYIAYDLKPQIDSLFPTIPVAAHTCIAGCSLGGIMALYGVMKYPTVFRQAMLFSPSLRVSERFYDLPAEYKDWQDSRVYIGVGDSEGFMDDDAMKLYKLFLEAGIHQDQIIINVEKGMGHRHETWKAAFRKAYPWMMKM